MKDSDWLASLTVGDEIAVGDFIHGYTILKIDRITNTQFICGESRYRRLDGRLVGSDSWTIRYIQPVTDKVRARVLAGEVKRLADSTALARGTIEELKSLREILTAIKLRKDAE